MTPLIVPARREHLAAIRRIEKLSFSDPWTQAMFAAHLSAARSDVFLVTENDNSVRGYAVARTVSDESELLNIAVAPDSRGQGIGGLLLDSVIEQCRKVGALEMWLEVRESNAGARSLYDARGFVAVGTRKRYYHAPREDAIILRADFRSAVGNELVTGTAGGFTAARVDTILSPASHFPRQETK